MWSGPVELGAMRQRMVTAGCSRRSTDADDAVARRTSRRDDLDLIAWQVSEHGGADGRASGDAAGAWVGLGRPDDPEGRLSGTIVDDHGRAELDPVDRRTLLDDVHVAQELFEGLDASFGERLLSPGFLVLRVLAEVAKLACGLDAGHDGRPGDRRELLVLGLHSRQATGRDPRGRAECLRAASVFRRIARGARPP